MLQTWWDVNKQVVRKAVDGVAGAVAGWLIAKGEYYALAAPFVVLAGNFVWFVVDNRLKVTVKGLAEAGMSNAAVTVEDALAKAEMKK